MRNKLQRAVMRARAIFLRFGISIQRGSVVRAYEEFHSLWLEEFEQNRVPGVGTLCALVIAHRKLPNKGDVTEAWASEAEKVLKDAAKEWVLPAHEFTDAVHRLGCCNSKDHCVVTKFVHFWGEGRRSQTSFKACGVLTST